MGSLQQRFLCVPMVPTLNSSLFLKFEFAPTSLHLPPIRIGQYGPRAGTVSSIEEIPPNALRRKCDPQWRGGFSLGIDLGFSRTGLAISKGFAFRPLTVLRLRGQKLEMQLIEIAGKEEVDEFIIGLPKSWDGKETPQSNKVRSVAGRLAVRAAERGWRVYLQDEHGTSTDATNLMIDMIYLFKLKTKMSMQKEYVTEQVIILFGIFSGGSASPLGKEELMPMLLWYYWRDISPCQARKLKLCCPSRWNS